MISVIKSALATTDRSVRLLYANRNRESVIFAAELDALSVARTRTGSRSCTTSTSSTASSTPTWCTQFVNDDVDADFYVCGPAPFMDVVEDALALLHVPSDQVFIERFAFAAAALRDEPPATPATLAGRTTRRRRPSSSCCDGHGARTALPRRRDVPRDRASGRTARAVLLRSGELRDVHGSPRRRRGDDARQQRVDPGGGRRGLGAHLSGLPGVSGGHGGLRVVTRRDSPFSIDGRPRRWPRPRSSKKRACAPEPSTTRASRTPRPPTCASRSSPARSARAPRSIRTRSARRSG